MGFHQFSIAHNIAAQAIYPLLCFIVHRQVVLLLLALRSFANEALIFFPLREGGQNEIVGQGRKTRTMLLHETVNLAEVATDRSHLLANDWGACVALDIGKRTQLMSCALLQGV
jgi:hypothetical protein